MIEPNSLKILRRRIHVLEFLRRRIHVLEEYSAHGAEQAQRAGSEIFGLENSVKAIDGELKGLLDKHVMDAKRSDEEKFR